MDIISKADVLGYFNQRRNRFTNKQGVEIIFLDNSVCTCLTFEQNEEFRFWIGTEAESIEEFIGEFRIQNIEEIDEIGYNSLWIRYLNKQADIQIFHLELETTLSFRLHKNRTMVFSNDLHFFDEVYEHLTIIADFIRYITNNTKRLHVASDNRYKF